MALCALLTLTACGRPDEEEIGPAPVKEFAGSWRMINQHPDCTESFTAFGQRGIYRLSKKDPPQIYVAVRKIQVGPQKAILFVTGLDADDKVEYSHTFQVKSDQLRLEDMQDSNGVSLKAPPADIDSNKAIFLVNEQKFAMNRCVAG